MSNWQMIHNNYIAYASWDFNSLATLLFVKQLVQANMKENIKPTFCEGNPPVMESPHTGPKLHSSHPLQRDSSGDQWFHRTPPHTGPVSVVLKLYVRPCKLRNTNVRSMYVRWRKIKSTCLLSTLPMHFNQPYTTYRHYIWRRGWDTNPRGQSTVSSITEWQIT